MQTSIAKFSTRRPARGFSLVEVILALGVMAIAIVSILGLIGTTLSNVRETEDIIAGTATIGKMNAIIENTVFWDVAQKDESVYWWVHESKADSPTVFLFYDENPLDPNGQGGGSPIQRVVRFNVNSAELNTPSQAYIVNKDDPNVPQLPVFVTLTDFVQAVAGGRVTGAVIAMTVSVSPLMKNFPIKGTYGNEALYYKEPANGGLFPEAQGMPADPSGGGVLTNIYPEGYFPILVQAFTLPVGNIQTTTDAATLGRQIVDSLTAGNRKFTYTTAKLR